VYHARVERAAVDLHGHIDQMNHALREWRDAQRQLEPLEARLKALTERGAEILERWADVDDRHVHAIAEVEARLREFRETETRLQHEALDRLRAFERTLQQEWGAVRDMHEEPLRHVREQALALAETCRATADLSLRSYERTEARLAALEADLRADVSALSREVRTALELVRGSQPALPAAAPFPLESVMRIHEEERATDAPLPIAEAPPVPRALAPVPLRAVPLPVERPAESSAHDVEPDDTVDVPAQPASRDRRFVLATAAIVMLLSIAAIAWTQMRVSTRLDEATVRAAAAEQAIAATESQLAAAREEVQRQSSAAQDAVARASLLSDVMAAPDLVRFALTGVNEADGASGHVLWSRLQGLTLSAANLPPLSNGAAYRVWLLSSDVAIAAGTLEPDADGRATLVARNPPNLPRPINGLRVTLEPAGSVGTAPTGSAVLIRAVPVPVPVPAVPQP
jgi:hypothetical protein